MLPDIYGRFIQASAVTVMLRAVLERALNPEQLDVWFARTAPLQYTRDLLFSSVFDLMSRVVLGVRPSVNKAYKDTEEIAVSITAVYDKLKRIEPHTSAELVRYSAGECSRLIDEIGGGRAPLLPGLRVKMLDGNCLEASERRLKPLRTLSAGPLPGKSLVVYDPQLDLMTDVFPCEDGHAQERALLGRVLPRIRAGEVWIGDRNFCVRQFLLGFPAGAYWIMREHQQLPWRALDAMRTIGSTDTGVVSEQPIEIEDRDGKRRRLRRIRVNLYRPTRDGETTLYILTTLPEEVADAIRVAELYRKRWTIETAFQRLERDLNSEINALGYPKAALFGFCVALVAYNTLAVVQAALRAVFGAEKIDREFSAYDLAEEIGTTYRGMMIAIPPEEWFLFRTLTVAQMAELLCQMATKVRLSAFRKQPRGPKKPKPKRKHNRKHPHVSTARLLAKQDS